MIADLGARLEQQRRLAGTGNEVLQRRVALADTLKKLTMGGRALLISTHDVDFAEACADRVVALADGSAVSG